MKSVSSPGTGRQDVTPGHSRIRCSRTWQWWDSMNLVIAGAAMQVRRLICRMHLEFPLWKVLRRVRIRIPVVYDYFWQDKGGFDYLRFIYDAEYGKGGPNGDYQSPTGANHVKHLYGNNNDHVLGLGVSAGNMYSGLATHILRLSDIYLVYAEAKMGLATSTTDQSALDAFNAVRGRAIPGVTPKTSITWEDVWKERRLELACEGDRWYDYVRLAYYDSQRAINELKAQRRDVYYSLGTTYKAYYENGSWTVNPDETRYNPDAKAPNVTVSSFTLPFPTEDVVFNPNLMKDPVHVDVRSEFSY